MPHVSPFARLHPLPTQQVTLTDAFWASRRNSLVGSILPHQYKQITTTGRLNNFYVAAGKPGSIQGYYFNDSDVYKWLEAAVTMLAEQPDPELQRHVETVTSAIEQAQLPDGYLDTYFSGERSSQRWNNLRDLHELYCAGQFFQAAAAQERAGSAHTLLPIARKLADHLISTFGPGGKPGVPGHPEVEMALVELYRTTKDRRYLDLVQSFIDQRGRGLIGGSAYHLDHKPLREMPQLAGHAVRALYLCSGAADLYLETGEAALFSALQRQWQQMVASQVYITGGLGARHEGEAFGESYELPNARAYAETCAGIASVYWNARMQSIQPNAAYADLLEWTLYNAVLPGLSLDGLEYFYVNPLSSPGSHRRQPWYECACCPPNLARLLADLPGYFYSTSLDYTQGSEEFKPDSVTTARMQAVPGVWVHQYASNTASLPLGSRRSLRLAQISNYPWEGELRFEIQAIEGRRASQSSRAQGTRFNLFLRIPAWCESLNADEASGAGVPTLAVNGEPVTQALQMGSYVALQRHWNPGDVVTLSLPMPVRVLESHPYVLENQGRVAITRGPLLYCLEAADQPDCKLADLVLHHDTPIQVQFEPDLLGGVTTLKLQGHAQPPDAGWGGKLYRQVSRERLTAQAASATLPLTAIPYFAWANREAGEMTVFLRQDSAA